MISFFFVKTFFVVEFYDRTRHRYPLILNFIMIEGQGHQKIFTSTLTEKHDLTLYFSSFCAQIEYIE